MEIVHDVDLDLVALWALRKRSLVLVEKSSDGSCKDTFKIVDVGNSKGWRKESLESLVRHWASDNKVRSMSSVKLTTTLGRGTYISPNNPGLNLSREISAYMATFGRSILRRICFIASLSEIHTCRGPRRTIGPYFL